MLAVTPGLSFLSAARTSGCEWEKCHIRSVKRGWEAGLVAERNRKTVVSIGTQRSLETVNV